MKHLFTYFFFSLFIVVFSAPMLILENPIVQGGIAYCGTRSADCSRSINNILTTMNHTREAYNSWSADFNYRRMELLKFNQQSTKFFEANRGRDVPFVNGK